MELSGKFQDVEQFAPSRWSVLSGEPHLQLPLPQTTLRAPIKPGFGSRDEEFLYSESTRPISNPTTPKAGPANTLRTTPFRSSLEATPILKSVDGFLQPAAQADRFVASSTNPAILETSRIRGVSPVSTDPLFGRAGAKDVSVWNGVHGASGGLSDINETEWQKHQQNPSQPLPDVARLRGILDQCLTQDERCINVDEFLSTVPVGNYISTDKAFHLSSITSPDTNNRLQIPDSLNDALQKRKSSGQFLCGSIANLETFWYVNDKSVYLWKWVTTVDQQLELCFNDPVVAVGVVDPKPFLAESDETSKFPISKVLLTATTTQISLWFLRLSADAKSIFDAVSSSFICPSPSYPVTAIVGHDESGRLFYGDANGGVYEFVFSPPSSSQETWASSLLRFSGWNTQTSGQQRTVSQQVVGPSAISRVLGRWAGGRRPVTSLSFDPHRALLYSVDDMSNVDIFYLPPPDIADMGVTEYPLQPIASLSHGQATMQMTNVYRQVLRATQPEAGRWDRTLQNLIDKCMIVKVVPLGRNEGTSVAAVALTSDGSRLFLRLRLELPLLPKRLETTHNVEITNYQYVKAVDVLNWKPPPPIDERPHPTASSHLFLNNRTFICAFSSPDSSLLMCITPDEGDIYQRQQGEIAAVARSPKTLREWWQTVPLNNDIDISNCEILSIYEQSLESGYRQLLEGKGPLPDPFNISGRLRALDLIAQREREESPHDNIQISARQSFGRNCRVSVSPWDVPMDVYPRTDPESVVGLGRVSTCHQYIPPSSLHSLSATYTLPPRAFIILTDRGVFKLHQLRFSEFFKNAAEEFLANDDIIRQPSFIIDSFCSPLSPTESPFVQSILSPESQRSVPKCSSKLSVLNVFAAAQLFGPEQVMAVIWQTLTFSYGQIPWPSMRSKSHRHDANWDTSTPFNRPRSDTYGATRRTTTPGPDRPSIVPSQKAFPRSLLIDIFVNIMVEPSVHNDPLFMECIYATIEAGQGVHRVSNPFGTAVTTARLKGLAIFISRILRPFWAVSIFEAGIVCSDYTLETLVMTCPGVYRQPPFNRSEPPTAKLFEVRIENEEDLFTNNKRRRSDDCVQFDSKRLRNSSNSRPVSQSPSSVTHLISRFTTEMFDKTRSWLRRLEGVVTDVVALIENSNKTDELKSLRYSALFCKIAEQTLNCCSMLLNVSEGRELPAEIFDLLVTATLSDFICSSAYRDVLHRLLSHQVLSPSLLRGSCDWIFGREDLDLQCSLQPLKTLHQSIYQMRWRRLPFPDCVPIERNAAFRSAPVQAGVRALLTAATMPTVSQLELGPIVTLLAELQMFDVLAEFIARLAESLIIQNKHQQQQPYMSDPCFRECLQKYYIVFDHILNYYYLIANQTNGITGREIASELVRACLASDRSIEPIQNNTDPRATAREWLHFVILDWINECGQRTFPLPLESVSSPVYSSWMGYHKEDLGEKAAHILSEFFLNNGQYSEFANFLIGGASKPWPDPKTMLEDIPNNLNPTTVSLVSLDRHASGVVGSAPLENVRAMSEQWTEITEYLRSTQAGTSLAERQRLLIQARDGLTGPGAELTNLLSTVNRLIDMVNLQAALVRETIEVAIFLMVKFPDSKNAFSSDHTMRREFMRSFKSNHRNRYFRVRNVQSLLYVLQWMLFDSPSKLSSILQEFALAVAEDRVPVPGLALLQYSSITKNILDEETNHVLSRVVADAIYCRCYIAVRIKQPEPIEDFISKYVLMVLGSQSCDTKADGLHEDRLAKKILLKGMPNVLFSLHDAALEFKDEEEQTQRAAGGINWELNWWRWPICIIRRQLTIVDNFINGNSEGKLDGQNQLPVIKSLIDSYQGMMSNCLRHPKLQDYHIFMIMLDLQESWLQQLFRMSCSLAFIHLLGGDDGQTTELELESFSDKLIPPLSDMFYRSPSKIQILSDKCADAVKACQAGWSHCKDWFLMNGPVIDQILADSDSATPSRLTELRLPRRSFLDALERVQRRLPVLQQYQQVLQRVASGTRVPSASVAPMSQKRFRSDGMPYRDTPYML